MLYTVLTASRSKALSGGLTYEGPEGLLPGTPVKVPLRSSLIEGVVLEAQEKKTQQEFDLKQIAQVTGTSPLLGSAQVVAARELANHYLCSFRQAIELFLPQRPWTAIFPKKKKEVEVTELQTLTAPALSESQQKALDIIKASNKPTLLYGVTGSGKTEVYLSLMVEALNGGKQVLFLSAEIFLAEHVLPRLQAVIPRDRIAVLHSKTSTKEDRETWRGLLNGNIRVVLGARSALFAPVHNLGLVIIDEEHEWTYKSEQTPRYHAREVAEFLCKAADARLVLGSATPSLEAWAQAKSAAYTLAELPERYNGGQMPKVEIIDLATAEFGKHYPFTSPLIDAIQMRLDRGEQSVLFLNHRGRASALLCLQCRRRIVSPESQLPFTVHHANDGRPFLLDHTSGLTAPVPDVCPHCQSTDLREVGAGTQRIEESIKELFPKARVLRADRDTLTSVEEMQSLLEKMKNGEADILLGTQTVTKGLDLPRVTLAAVLVADIGMSLPHFRAGERTFQLLMQLTGRSGRHAPGEVIIQTFRPDAVEVKAAATHDATTYLDTELRLRLAMGYPPAIGMVRLIIRGERPRERALAAKLALETMAKTQNLDSSISAGPTFFSGGKEWHILVRSNSYRALLEAINLQQATVDVEPLETL